MQSTADTFRAVADAPPSPPDNGAAPIVSVGEDDALFAIVFRDAPDAIVVIDAEHGTIIDANRALRHFLGYEPHWLVGRPFAALCASGALRSPIAERVRLHGAVIEELDLRRIDGSLCPMRIRAALARWRGRWVIIATLRDERDRRRAEDGRRRAEERYRSIFEHTVEGIFQTTVDGRYLTANPALARIYGYDSPDELIERLTDIAGQLYIDPRRRLEFRRRLEEHDVVQGFESQVYRRDGSVTWISENARAVRDADGALRHYEGTVIDISTRKQAEAARRAEAEVASALARVGQEMIASLDSPEILDRLCRLTAEVLVCDWSQALVWETDDDAFVPAPATATAPISGARVPRTALAPLLARLERDEVALLDGEACAQLPSALLPAGRPCGAALYFAIRRAGACVGVLMAGYRERPEPFSDAQVRIARGIAHLAALALEHARLLDELGRANRLKSEFVATMSHELRTPLNIILGYNDLLLERSFGPLTAQQTDILARVGRNGRELLDLINATLDLSRLETGRLPIDVMPVRLDALARQLDVETHELLREKPAVALRWNLAGDLPELATDAAKLRIIVKNLLNNAVKFTERGQVDVGIARLGDGVELTVRDTGIGIAAESLPIIFDAFRQVDSSMTRRHGGVGLGLHVVQRLVGLLGGSVSVASNLGIGSTFKVWLPVANASR